MFWYHYADLISLSDEDFFNTMTWYMNDLWWQNCSLEKYVLNFRLEERVFPL